MCFQFFSMATINVSLKRFCDVVKVVIVQKNNLTKFGYYLFEIYFFGGKFSQLGKCFSENNNNNNNNK